MPRKAKSQSATKTAPGQPYGVAGEQVAAMQQLPLPDRRVSADNKVQLPATPLPSSSSPSASLPIDQQGPTVDVAGISDTAQSNSLQQALNDAAAMPAPTSPAFSTPPTADETNRLSTNNAMPMAAVRQNSPVVQMLQQMVLANPGDEKLEEIAARAARLGY